MKGRVAMIGLTGDLDTVGVLGLDGAVCDGGLEEVDDGGHEALLIVGHGEGKSDG